MTLAWPNWRQMTIFSVRINRKRHAARGALPDGRSER
ncbi:hypothetical protein CONSTELLA_176 [Mycobacterium phage Constella]|uniref:Uncharacterized protein n=1 Tax=Mycobacterium phage Baka TaxID=2902882 RepID=G1D0E4_9CAUD|nr:hypothetical protein VC71_gp180 [Mycobacterium phage Minerva]YP_009636357.1 hypothetical protein FGG20_gp186 [Mycobacterium phage Baka]ATN89049.1 hypothetical protein SEA_DMPSTRDIVER_181 [Mycobacterium phage DmpstrDiver]ATN89960.1 hypothetical protein SEA_KLEIN_184 [Mycobacterium phage Klein]AXF51666.1 hypothetical protein CONSTELLA_176 [Mycobacterium phage Constella]AYB69664.1 hypothetical protein SEA_KALAH2_177 [Mycobacterium phage Kalah2]AEK08298.1 hypothetical protein PBI_BAKA_186 [Myc